LKPIIRLPTTLLTLLTCGAAAGTSAAAPQSRSVEIAYSASLEPVPAGAHRVEFWLPYPTSDGNQDVQVLQVSGPGTHQVIEESRFGNSILHFVVNDPGASDLGFSIEARVTRKEYVRTDFGGAQGPTQAPVPVELASWLKPDRLVPLDERIRTLAAEVTKGRTTPLAKAQAIYDYVVDTMSYDKSGTGWGHGDIYWACDAKRGNCTDFHALFVGLARSVGIPAKFEIGFPLPAAHGHGEIAGYHCWAEFYLAGYGWVPVDASEARRNPDKRHYFFGTLDENRVQFSIGRDLVLAPPQAGAPLNYFIYPYVEVDGKPYDKVSRTFSFHDQETAPLAAKSR
jgi:transglutaminase-like putative cysteine protease